MELYIVQIKKVNIMSDNLNPVADDQAVHKAVVNDISSEVAQKMSPIIESVSAIAEVVKSQSEDMKNMCDSIKSLSDIIAEEKKSNAQKSRKIGFGNRETVHITVGDDISLEECVKTYDEYAKKIQGGAKDLIGDAKYTKSVNTIVNAFCEKHLIDKKNTYNAFNPQQGGFALQNPTFIGTYDSNPIQYPNVLDLVGDDLIKATVGSSQKLIGIDYAGVSVFETQEGGAVLDSGTIKMNEAVFDSQEISHAYAMTKTMYNIISMNNLTFDLAGAIELARSMGINQMLAAKALNQLKDAVKNNVIGSYTMGTAGSIVLEDLFKIYNNLKTVFRVNAVLYCNESFTDFLSSQVGNDGQYKTSSVLGAGTQKTGVGQLEWLGKKLTIYTIPETSTSKFDTYVDGINNAGKLIGIFADFKSLFKCDYKSPLMTSRVFANNRVKDYGEYDIIDTMYIAGGLVNKQAGYGIVCG
jgi:HK97 family phage major capsid protein